MPSLVLGTAGHIDHGKSALVKALTGTDPDRLAQEKERGITIELGFARLDLPSGRSMGVVDVPGHERFVRQMVAGATGIDVVLLVIAADDGVMPQTREHLAVIDLLGIEQGVVALTKSDLVDDEWLALVEEDVERLLKGTSIEGAPIIACSAKTGAGLDELLEALDSVAEGTASERASLPMRLPVDRVFTIAGAGTVVTGTMWSGSVEKDDLVEILPSGKEGRVRGVQVHSEEVVTAHAGQRVAVNIAGLGKEEISRGDVVAAPGTLKTTDRFDAHFTFLGFPESSKVFESDTRVHVHHGTREVLGRVLLMEGGDSLEPGGSVLAQLRLEEPIVPRYGDRFIVRSYSPVYTIGGGVILDVLPPRRTRLKPHERDLLVALREHDLAAASVGLLSSRGIPMTADEVASAIGITVSEVAAEFEKADLERVEAGGERYFVTAQALDDLVARIESGLRAYHEENPKATGMPTAALKDRVDHRLAPKLFDALLMLAESKGVAEVQGGEVRHPESSASALAEEEAVAEALPPLLAAQGLSPKSVADTAAEIGADPDVVRRVLTQSTLDGKVVRLGPEMHFSASAIEDARETLREYLARHPQGATAAELRDALGVSRKYAIPLLEYFDAQGLTRREGDLRFLKGG